jgi:uncharacterized protein (TIGR04551 family)
MRRLPLLRSVPQSFARMRELVLLAPERARVATLAMPVLLAIVAAPLVFASAPASAQDAGQAGEADAGAPETDTTAAEPAPAPEPASEPAAPEPEASGPGPVLEPPQLTPLALDPDAGAPAAPAEGKPAVKPVQKKFWTRPETMFHLHGYMRIRGGLLKDGHLGRSAFADRLPYNPDGTPRFNSDPFTRFISTDSRPIDPDNGELAGTPPGTPPVDRGCGDNPGGEGACKKEMQVGGDMRLRLKPEVHLSDDIRLKAWIDVLDNVGLGTQGYGANELELQSAIRVRRAWGEARNRDVGEIRFGRMGADWGLGILDNGGDRNGIDSDFSSDVDRIMGMTNLGGFYFMTAYDWASQGKVLPGATSPSGVPIDRAQRDDQSAVTAAIAHRLDSEVQRSTLLRGEAVFNYGVYFVWRKQLLKNVLKEADQPYPDGGHPFMRVNQKQYIPDLWAQFLWEGLRIELEAAFVAGSMEGSCPRLDVNTDGDESIRDAAEITQIGTTKDKRDGDGECKFRQLGVALEAEYRLLDDRLGIHFLSGFASGDSHSYGLAQTNDPVFQRSTLEGDRTVSTFQFHPDYRVDLILWRTLMRRVAGAYYFKPGVSYDFIHDPYGQVAGARVDAIYSRAMSAQQTYGRDANLGLELDVSLYYRSEDGPDLWDGFYTTIQWGILFPFQGLEYPDDYNNATDSKNAMIFRGYMGIAF